MKICLFDIDGTLLSSGGAGKAAMEAALLAEFDLPKLLGQVSYSGRTDRAIVTDLLRHHAIEETLASRQRFLDSYLRRLPEHLMNATGKGVLPGITYLLEYLGERERVAVGLLTGNIREGARIKLSHYGLYQHFPFGGFGDEHHDRNEVAREALATVRERFGPALNGDNIWVIGDTPMDVRCARAIGARCLAVATGFHSVVELSAAEPDLLLPDLSDPDPFLQLWR
jgi:phosphoglycolate phosphatase-like HAD superfamily hydrolase